MAREGKIGKVLDHLGDDGGDRCVSFGGPDAAETTGFLINSDGNVSFSHG